MIKKKKLTKLALQNVHKNSPQFCIFSVVYNALTRTITVVAIYARLSERGVFTGGGGKLLLGTSKNVST